MSGDAITTVLDHQCDLPFTIITDNESEHSFSSNQGIRSIVSIPLRPQAENHALIMESKDNDDSVPLEQSPDPLYSVAQTSPDGDLPPELPALATDILDALGESKTKTESFAPNIRDEIAERWGKIILDGLSKESVQKLMENIRIPENFKLLKAPELNTEIATVLAESTRNRDKRLEKAQNHLGMGIAAITNLMSTLINGNMEKTEIIKKLSEAGQLLIDLHCQNTSARRKLITFSLDKKFLTMIHDVKRDTFLFGDKLGEKIKANKSAEKSGFQIKRTFEPQPSTSSYRPNQSSTRQGNWRGPPKSQVQRGRRGGLRNQFTSQTFKRPTVSASATTSDRYNSSSNKTNNKKPGQKN